MFASFLKKGRSTRPFGSSFTRLWHDVANQGRLGSLEPCPNGPRILSAYTVALHRWPRTCSVISCFVAASLGDVAAQLTTNALVRIGWKGQDIAARDEYFSADFSAQRTLTFSLVVSSLVGFCGDVWYRQLLVKFPGWTYEVALRTILDQVRNWRP